MEIDELNDVIRDIIHEESNRLIEQDPEEYYIGKENFGSMNNGCGFVKLDGGNVYDEDRAWDDAVEAIAIDIANGSEYYQLFDNNKFTEALAKYIRTF